jgi:hypothetical protein
MKLSNYAPSFPGKTLLLLGLCGFASLGVTPASATTRPVTTTADTVNSGDGVLSLREAIQASAEGDAIIFSVIGTITLTLGELVIGRNVTITGPAGGVAVSGNNASRVLRIDAGTVNISNLTIRDGSVIGATGGNGTGSHGDGYPGGNVSGGGAGRVGAAGRWSAGPGYRG